MSRAQRWVAAAEALAGARDLWPAAVPREYTEPVPGAVLADYLAQWAAERPGTVAIHFYGRDISYAELERAAAAFAGWLRANGVRAGDRVGVHLVNCPQLTIAFLGILRIGAVYVPINPMFKAGELAYELADAGVGVLLAHPEFAPLIDAVRGGEGIDPDLTVAYTRMADMIDGEPVPRAPFGAVDPEQPSDWEEILASPPAEAAAADRDALAALNYTGGTTGMPKGCEHTQGHMVYTAVSAAGANGFAPEEIVSLCFVPVFWIAGEDLGILIPLVMGGTSILLSRWDAATVVDLVERHGVTTTAATVESYLAILDLPDIADRDLSSFTSPMAMSFIRKLTPEVRRRWAEVVGGHSVLREGSYGLTESHTIDVVPHGFQADDHDLTTTPVFCGLPVPGTDVLVVDPVTAEPMPLGEPGEIILRSPSITTGYWRNPEATARQLRDGWLHTGDTGYLDDDGCLHYLARAKDMIKVSGMSVFPAEVESLLVDHPAIDTVAVVPAPDPESGQRPVAFVTTVGEVTGADVEQWARDRMAVYKVPFVEVLDAFPLTDTGKIRKGELLERAGEVVAARG